MNKKGRKEKYVKPEAKEIKYEVKAFTMSYVIAEYRSVPI